MNCRKLATLLVYLFLSQLHSIEGEIGVLTSLEHQYYMHVSKPFWYDLSVPLCLKKAWFDLHIPSVWPHPKKNNPMDYCTIWGVGGHCSFWIKRCPNFSDKSFWVTVGCMWCRPILHKMIFFMSKQLFACVKQFFFQMASVVLRIYLLMRWIDEEGSHVSIPSHTCGHHKFLYDYFGWEP